MNTKLIRLINLFSFNIARLFPVLYHILPIKPISACINITNRCCLKCKMCSTWQDTNNYINSEKDTTFWKDIIDQLKTNGIYDLNFSGGEPLLRKDLPELIKYASSKGILPSITTNGYLLNKELLLELIDNGLKHISISLDAIENDYDELRGIKGAYDRLYKILKEISILCKNKRLSAHIYFLLMKDTLKTYKQVFSIAKELNIPLVVNLLDYNPYFLRLESNKTDLWINETEKLNIFIQDMISNKLKNKNFTYHTIREIIFFKEYFKDHLQKSIPCSVSQERIFIDPSGNFYAGCWALKSLGDLNTNSIKDILKSKEYKNLLKRLFLKNCPGCSCGYSQNLRSSIPDIFKQFAYYIIFKLKINYFKNEDINNNTDKR